MPTEREKIIFTSARTAVPIATTMAALARKLVPIQVSSSQEIPVCHAARPIQCSPLPSAIDRINAALPMAAIHAPKDFTWRINNRSTPAHLAPNLCLTARAATVTMCAMNAKRASLE